MIVQATVEDVANSRITKRHGQVVVVTRYYPRFLKKKLIHDYAGDLAPTRALLKEFKDCEAELGDHDRAFDVVDYESKFQLPPEAVAHLQMLSDATRESKLYLICHCRVGQRCHREILMLIAEARFGLAIGRVSFPWTRIRERIALGEFTL